MQINIVRISVHPVSFTTTATLSSGEQTCGMSQLDFNPVKNKTNLGISKNK